MKMSFGLLISLISFSAFATESESEAHRKQCAHGLARMGLKVIPSGRDHEHVHQLAEVAKQMQRVMYELGGKIPDHQLEFVPGGQLMALASLGRHPIPFWGDGAQLVKNPFGALGVLEFVTPGCPVCKSFYRDSLDPREQVAIIQHVLGHNDFSETSMYARIRKADPIAESLALERLIEKYSVNYDADSVSRWYQYLETVTDLQDLVLGGFDDPSTFDPSNVPGVSSLPPRAILTRETTKNSSPYGSPAFPPVQTASILQFLVHNLPAEASQWKKDILYHTERMNRVYGFYSSNKIMNEGWATLMMYMLADHAGPQSDDQMFTVLHLLKGVAGRKDLSNPYWLGLQAWMNLRERFNNEPENKNLDNVTRDKKFFAYAHEIIEQYNDFDFLKMALDARWVDKQRIYLFRKAERQEIDPNMPPPMGPDGKPIPAEQKIVESVDAKRVIDVLVEQVADRRYQRPRILLDNARAFGRNVFSMVHDSVDNIPLDLRSAVQALYVMTQIKEATMSLKTIHPDFNPQTRHFDKVDIRIEVDPNGKVQFFVTKDGKEELDLANSQAAEKAVIEYLENQEGAVNAELEDYDLDRLRPAVEQAVNVVTSNLMGLISHAPTASKAVLAYSNMVQRRLTWALMRVAQGKAPLKQTKTGVRISVLPMIPKFRLDYNQMEIMKKMSRLEILQATGRTDLEDVPGFSLSIGFDRLPSADVDVGHSRKRPRKGEKFWGPPSDGQGNGNGDPEDGDGEPTDRPGSKPGSESGDPSEIEIPLEVYAKFLLQAIELPNLRPKTGKVSVKDSILEGGTRRPFGDILYTRMMPNVMSLGADSFRRQGIDPRTKKPAELAKEGFKYVSPSDYVVRDREEVKQPDINAIVILLMDESGSMFGWPVEASKKFLFNLRAALLTKYKNVQFRYISMDTDATVHTDMHKFFKSFKGGGTHYLSGFKKATEVLEDFPRAKWDRYVVGIGDSEDMFTPETGKAAEELHQALEYFAYIHVVLHGGGLFFDTGFQPFIKKLLDGQPFGGYAEMTQASDSDMEVLKKLFGKKK